MVNAEITPVCTNLYVPSKTTNPSPIKLTYGDDLAGSSFDVFIYFRSQQVTTYDDAMAKDVFVFDFPVLLHCYRQ